MILHTHDIDYEKYLKEVRDLNLGKNKKAYVFTFGCQQNEADSEKIRAMARDMGYARAECAEDADLIILNTCAIREHAEMKALSMLGRFKSLRRENPELIIGVCGCMAAEKHISDMLKTDFHYVSFTLAPNMLHELPRVIHGLMEGGRRRFTLDEDKGDIVEGISPLRTEGHRAWVSIMYGCNNFCSYCIVPYVRGRERSRDSSAVIEECRGLVADGCREITLLGQNVNSYRSDISFAELLRKIAEIEGDFLIRFMTSHPKDVSDELIAVMSECSPKVAPYFHLPLQSGSDRILEKMNRKYDKERFLSVARELKSRVPGIALSTDVIVGFPTEGEEDFLDTLAVLSEVRFDMVYAFIYSPRVGTPAAKMDGQIEKSVKEERLGRLLAMQDEISREESEKYVGTVQRVLVESTSKRRELNTLTARTASNKLVHFTADGVSVGDFTEVKITNAAAYDLTAEII
ncbi:MAG: tRNA (N6-isopentenyl adenosine(37)-C2)-methylthiotransferase MiaB [Clostridia bacterium]|nr:tRNA (N6-isopentenyl adenosine(37)-C2)-methylthiotransferase MiaB [Clostridia bacterium]